MGRVQQTSTTVGSTARSATASSTLKRRSSIINSSEEFTCLLRTRSGRQAVHVGTIGSGGKNQKRAPGTRPMKKGIRGRKVGGSALCSGRISRSASFPRHGPDGIEACSETDFDDAFHQQPCGAIFRFFGQQHCRSPQSLVQPFRVSRGILEALQRIFVSGQPRKSARPGSCSSYRSTGSFRLLTRIQQIRLATLEALMRRLTAPVIRTELCR